MSRIGPGDIARIDDGSDDGGGDGSLSDIVDDAADSARDAADEIGDRVSDAVGDDGDDTDSSSGESGSSSSASSSDDDTSTDPITDNQRPGAGQARSELEEIAENVKQGPADVEPTSGGDSGSSSDSLSGSSGGGVSSSDDDTSTDPITDNQRGQQTETGADSDRGTADSGIDTTDRRSESEQPADQQQRPRYDPTPTGGQTDPTPNEDYDYEFNNEQFADPEIGKMTPEEIAQEYDVYDEPYQVTSTASGPPIPGQLIVSSPATEATDDFVFDPTDPESVEKWRSRRREANQNINDPDPADVRRARQRLEDLDRPDPFVDRDILSEPMAADSTTDLKSEYADRYTQATVDELSFDADDISLEQTEDGRQVTLDDRAQTRVRDWQTTVYRANVRALAGPLVSDRYTYTDVSEDDLTFEDGALSLDSAAQARAQRNQQQIAENAARGEKADVVREANELFPGVDVGIDDAVLAGDGPRLDRDTQQAVRQANRQQRREQAAEEFSEQFGTDIQPSEVELTDDGPQLTEGTQALVEDLQMSRGAESLESEIEAALTRDSAFDPAQPDQATIPDLNLTGRDVTRTATGLTLSESGQAKVEETELAAAREQIERQVPITLSDADIERRDGTITLSEQGRQKLTDYQQTRATQQLLQDLRAETGAELEESDIDVAATEDDGEIQFEAELTKSGQRELAGEQVPGSDLPVIGGGLEAGGEFGERINQERLAIGDEITDRLPEVEVPEVPTPSREQVAGAAAFGVAAPEPVTSATGGVILGGITLGSLTVAGAQRLGERLPDQAQASVTQEEIPVPTDGTTRDITEITTPTGGDFLLTEEQPTTGDAVPQRELPVGQGLQDITELSTPSQFEQADPRTLQTDATVGESVTDDTPFSPGTTLPTPGDMGDEMANRQTFERTFPTGESAVVGEGAAEPAQERVEEAQKSRVTDSESELAQEQGGSESVPGNATGPTVGLPADTVSQPDVISQLANGKQTRPISEAQSLAQSERVADTQMQSILEDLSLIETGVIPGTTIPDTSTVAKRQLETVTEPDYRYQEWQEFTIETRRPPRVPRPRGSDSGIESGAATARSSGQDALKSGPVFESGYFNEFVAARAGVDRSTPDAETLAETTNEFEQLIGAGPVEAQVSGTEQEQEAFAESLGLFDPAVESGSDDDVSNFGGSGSGFL